MFSRGASWIVLIAVWTVIGGLLTLELYLTLRPMHDDLSIGSVAFGQFMRVSFWAALTPLVFWLQRRAPIMRTTWFWSVPLHLVLSVAAMVLIYMARLFIAFAYYGENLGEYWQRVVSEFYGRNLVDVPIYWTVFGTGYTLGVVERFRTARLQAAQLEKDLALAEMKALKAQLHPHFLFNTLNTIATLVRDEQNREAVALIARFSALLRTSLESTGRLEVTVQQELEFISRFLDIHQARFADRLAVRIDVQPGAAEALVPNLILQPLVENALIHGFANRPGPGCIEVRAARAGDELTLGVADDGPGFVFNDGVVREGFGLANTRERLTRMFDGRARLEYCNRSSGGAEVIMTLPFHTQPVVRTDGAATTGEAR